eukprot:UN00614
MSRIANKFICRYCIFIIISGLGGWVLFIFEVLFSGEILCWTNIVLLLSRSILMVVVVFGSNGPCSIFLNFVRILLFILQVLGYIIRFVCSFVCFKMGFLYQSQG